jgi:hypothetical protein
MVIVPAGSILVLRTVDGQTVELLTYAAADVDHEGGLDVLVLSDVQGEIERGMADVPTAAGLLHVPALLHTAEGRLEVHPAQPVQPLQRRLTPRAGLVLPLRGSAHLGEPGVGAAGAGLLVTFHGHTVDVGAGGLQARLIGDIGMRLPQQLRDVFVELDPGAPESLAVALRVVTFRSDVLRAQFSFIALADWIRLRERAQDQL